MLRQPLFPKGLIYLDKIHYEERYSLLVPRAHIGLAGLAWGVVEPQLHISHPLSIMISRLISQASVRLLHTVECIPVWHGARLLETYRISLGVLNQGKSILVFPENPALKMNELFMMKPFEKSFARLGELYFEQTKKILLFHPLAIHPAARKIKFGKPIQFNPDNDPVRECIRIKRVLESVIHDLYLSITLESYTGVPLPH